MPVVARLATIRLVAAMEPVVAAPISSGASISQSHRVTRTTSTHRRNRSFGITTAVVAPTDASLVRGRLLTAALLGVIWRALRAVPSETALVAPAITYRTGTTRASLLTQMTPTASSSTP